MEMKNLKNILFQDFLAMACQLRSKNEVHERLRFMKNDE